MKRKPFLRLAGAAGALLLAGCAAALRPADFAAATPVFDPIAFFTGHTVSQGVFENLHGEPVRRFRTEAVGTLKPDGALALAQDFFYADGSTQHRAWSIRRADAHHFEATADDVVGTAAGEACGNVFRWEYTVALKPGNPLLNVRLKQWMYLEPGGQRMVNRATVSSVLGTQAAQVTEYFERGQRPGISSKR